MGIGELRNGRVVEVFRGCRGLGRIASTEIVVAGSLPRATVGWETGARGVIKALNPLPSRAVGLDMFTSNYWAGYAALSLCQAGVRAFHVKRSD
jgi:hypothetical protein